MSDYRFFLSYSRRDAKEQGKKENAWFKRFREDLVRDVAREAKLPTDLPEEEVAFYDREGIDLADPWRHALLEGLQASRVIVCLYSQNYFASEYSGKEFQVFLRRQAENPAAGRRFIPILWDAPTKLPEPLPGVLAEAQFTHASLGALYAEKGLLHLLRMQEEVEYQRFLLAIADKINRAGRDLLARANIGTLDRVPSAFHKAKPATPGGDAPGGMTTAWMIYVAGTQADYVKRKHTQAYGAAGYEWQPYQPESPGIVGALASQVVAAKGLFPHGLAIAADLREQLRHAEEKNTMVLILVDPWAVEITTYDHVFTTVDRDRLDNCGVIIPWNASDPELAEPDPGAGGGALGATRGDALQLSLAQSLSHIWDATDLVFVKHVPSEAEFKLALGRAIDEIRARISKRGRLLRGRAGTDVFPTLPPGTAAAPQPAADGGGQ
jgi:FxsC-like protein